MNNTNRAVFINALAHFLTDDQDRKSIELSMGKPHAKEWAALRSATPLSGYPTLEEARSTIGAWLGVIIDK